MVGGVDNHADATRLDVVQNVGVTFANLGSNTNINALLLQIFCSTAGSSNNIAQILKALSNFHSLRFIHVGYGNQDGAFVGHIDAGSQTGLVEGAAELVVAGHYLASGFHLWAQGDVNVGHLVEGEYRSFYGIIVREEAQAGT